MFKPGHFAIPDIQRYIARHSPDVPLVRFQLPIGNSRLPCR